jgi:hypothetical protein
LNVKAPPAPPVWLGPVTSTAVRASPSGSMSLPSTPGAATVVLPLAAPKLSSTAVGASLALVIVMVSCSSKVPPLPSSAWTRIE